MAWGVGRGAAWGAAWDVGPGVRRGGAAWGVGRGVGRGAWGVGRGARGGAAWGWAAEGGTGTAGRPWEPGRRRSSWGQPVLRMPAAMPLTVVSSARSRAVESLWVRRAPGATGALCVPISRYWRSNATCRWCSGSR